jgi:branched-chain amino acid aminotransferase
MTEVGPWPATARVRTCPWVRNTRGATTGLKTTSYAENGIALRHAHEHGSDEALFANTDGVLCEGAGSNVFVVVDEQIATPPLGSGCLAGVTRELLLEWLPGIAETDIEMSALETASEVFLTATSRNVHPVEVVNGRSLVAAPGPLTALAMAVFAERSPAEWSPADP